MSQCYIEVVIRVYPTRYSAAGAVARGVVGSLLLVH